LDNFQHHPLGRLNDTRPRAIPFSPRTKYGRVQHAGFRRKGNPLIAFRYVVPPFLITAILWASSNNPVGLLPVSLALILLYVPWMSFLHWRQHRTYIVPLFALISGIYWLYFGVALFWGEHRFLLYGSKGGHISDSVVTAVILMAVVGMLAMLAGTRTGELFVSIPKFSVGSPTTTGQWLYIDLILVLRLAGTRLLGTGGGARQVIFLLVEFIPLIAFVLLFHKFLVGRATSYEKVLLALFLVVKAATGLAAGWLGSVVSLFIVIVALYLQTRGKLPKLGLGLLVFYVLFFQVGKEDFRRRYWSNVSSTGTVERLTDWVGLSLQRWASFYNNPSQEQFQALVSQSVNRLSLLHLAASVVERTPDAVPYQGGKLYSYMFITLIPRFLWPEKPSFNEANQFYQVAYGLTRMRDLESTSISVGILAESYIGFGWPGVVVVMFLMGLFIYVFKSIFFIQKGPIILSAIGIAMLPTLLAAESQLVQYFGGMLQQIGVALCAFLPVIVKRSKTTASRRRHGEAVALTSR
jgi:hypothetical protein